MATTSVTHSEIVQQFFNESHFEGAIEELLTALEGPQPDSPFTQEKQVRLYHLLWEVRGLVDSLYEPCLHAGQIRTWKFLDRAQSELFGELPLSERAMMSARKAIQGLPDGPRKQAILFRRPKGVRRGN